MLQVLIVFIAVLLGATLQRVSGMGLGLLAAPVLSIVIGPIEGVLVLNLIAAVNAAINTVQVREFVDWRKFGLMSPFLVVGAIPAALLIGMVNVPTLQVLVGTLLLIALGGVVFGARHLPQVTGKVPAMIAGFAGGFMNTLAGVAGPSITVYAQATRWEQRSFAATLQPIFIVAGLASLLSKLSSGVGNVFANSPLIWIAGFGALPVAAVIGQIAARHVSREKARVLALCVAFAGSIVVVLRGLTALL